MDYVPEAPSKDVPCAYCDTSVVGHAFVMCASCEIPVHRDCWQEAQVCPAYACGNTKALDPAEALFRKKGGPALLGPGTMPAGAPGGPPGAMALATAAAASVFTAAAKSVAAVANAATHALTPPKPVGIAAMTQAERQAEIRRLEARLFELQVRRWKRTTVIMALVVMLPLVLRFIARPLLFPWMVVVGAYASWPGHREATRRHERALRQRLEQLELIELGQ